MSNKYKHIDWFKIGLGTITDSALSKKIDVPREQIGKIRRKFDIKPFNGHFLTQEGFSCRSYEEAVYDAYLHKNNIKHEHEIKIGKYRADFKLEDTYVEIARYDWL